MAIKLEMLRCFVAVGRCGNLVDAAKTLNRTPAAVSMTLKQFENQLGAALFASERKSKLTALGAFALAEAGREVDHFEQTVAAIRSYARSGSGLVRIAAVPSAANTLLPKVIQAFLSDHPKVSVDIRDMDSKGIVRELEQERINIGIGSGTGMGSEIRRETLFSDAYGIVCAADHPLTRMREPLPCKTLTAWPFIANGLCREIANPAFRDLLSKSQLMVRNTTSLLAMVRAGVGITVAPRLVVESNHQALAFLTLSDLNDRRPIEILRRAGTSLSPAARDFEHAIRKTAEAVYASGGGGASPANG